MRVTDPPKQTDETEDVTVSGGAGNTTMVKGTLSDSQPGEGVDFFTFRLKS